MLELCLRQCSRYASTVHKVCSTVLEVCFNWLEVCFDHARGIFRPSLKVCFYRSRDLFRLCLMYVSIVHEVCFDCARVKIRSCSRCVLIALELSFGRSSWYVSTVAWSLSRPCWSYVCGNARDMLRPSTKYVSTELEVCFNWLEVCFDHARGIFRLSLKVCFYRARDMLRSCTKFGSTMLELCLRQCSRYASTVHKVCFDRSRGMFQLTWGMFWPCTRYIPTVAQSMFLP